MPGLPAKEMLKSENLFAKSGKHSPSRLILSGLVLLSLFAGIFSLFGFSKDSEFRLFPSPIHASAASEQDASYYLDIVSQNINDILIWKTETEGASDLQDLIDTSFADDPISGTNQNYITSIIQNPYIDADLSKYISSLGQALDSAVASEEGIFPTSLQKSLATLKICIDYENKKLPADDDAQLPELTDYVNQVTLDTAINHTIGEKGIMSYIWGLYMLDTCRFSYGDINRYDYDEVIETLISYQCSDGGYTLSGDVGDVDVTAMAMQVLAPHVPSPLRSAWFPIDSLVVESVSASREFLDTHQLEDGDYESFGTRCSESTAQATLAYASMYNGFLIPIRTDMLSERRLLDGLLLYKQEDGGFAHTFGLPSNDMASSQVLQALTVMLPYEDSGSINAPAIRQASEIKPDSAGKRTVAGTLRILIPIAFSVAAVGVGIFFTIKRKKFIHLISAVLIAALFTGVFFALDIRSKSYFESRESTVILSSSDKNASKITFTISAYTVTDEEIYPPNTLYVAEDSTVFEILSEVCRTENIQLDYEKNSVYGLAYIKGINSIYEYDHGDLSGWMYRVNGELPNIGCGYYKVKDGDTVEILYSTNIGRDLGDD